MPTNKACRINRHTGNLFLFTFFFYLSIKFDIFFQKPMVAIQMIVLAFQCVWKFGYISHAVIIIQHKNF